MATLPTTDSKRNENGARRSGRILVVSIVLIAAIAAGGIYLFRWQPQRNDTSPESQPAEVSDVIAADDPEHLLEQRRQFLRTQLQAIVEQGDSISDDIDALQSEIDAYRQQYDLVLSKHAHQLVHNEMAVQRLFDGNANLPSRQVAKHFRMQLDTLMLAMREAVSDGEAVFKVSPEQLKRIEMVGLAVAEAKQEFSRHRLLLEALAKSASDKSPMKSESTQEPSTDVFTELIEQRPGDESGGGTTADQLREAELQPAARDSYRSIDKPANVSARQGG